MIICIAYNVQFYQVTAPDWSASLGYDIAAAVPAGATRDQFRLMLQNLLKERFHLALHGVTKELPAYSLVPAKGGPKIKRVDDLAPASQGAAPTMTTSSTGEMLRVAAHRQTLKNLAGYLSVQLQSPVDDETGLAGEYDFILEFASPQPTLAQTSAPSLFTAVEGQGSLE
jgi:uncharacterized protein (TIGR03435 family)